MHSTPSDAIIIGVDTHKDVHIAVAITGFGAHLGTLSIPATATGCQSALNWDPRSARKRDPLVRCVEGAFRRGS